MIPPGTAVPETILLPRMTPPGTVIRLSILSPAKTLQRTAAQRPARPAQMILPMTAKQTPAAIPAQERPARTALLMQTLPTQTKKMTAETELPMKKVRGSRFCRIPPIFLLRAVYQSPPSMCLRLTLSVRFRHQSWGQIHHCLRFLQLPRPMILTLPEIPPGPLPHCSMDLEQC